jgi:hypothetical protein
MGRACREEGRQICEVLVRKMPDVWEGQACILELKHSNYQWRQMEWIGWYNEFKARDVVRAALGGRDGPRYGNTSFDYQQNCVWDFKVHPAGERSLMILNDKEAVDSCIRDYGTVGFVVTLGTAIYDRAGAFKRWHDQLKGGVSSFEVERVARGAPSRKRKVRFRVSGFMSFVFDDATVVEAGIRNRWIRLFQEGMRNANGTPRRPKYMVDMERLPSTVLIAQMAA